MSAVVNGHREDENTTHSRPHGHILPMLSFSASTPTDEDNPLDSNPAIAIDMTLWEHPEDAIPPSIQISSQDDMNDDDLGVRNTEAMPLIDVARDVILIDGPDGEDDELDENAPLLAGGSRGVGSNVEMGLRVGSDDDDRNIGGLGIPVNMPRRSSSHIGIGLENGDIHADMETSIASFLRSKSESGNLASSSSAATNSEDGNGAERQDVLKNITQSSSVSELRDVASQLVFEVISQAQTKASNTNNLDSKVEENERIEDPHSDERLMEIVRRFVSNIMFAAKTEAWDSMRQIQNNNNNVLSLKGEEKQWEADPQSDEELMEKVRQFVSEIMAAAKAEAWDNMRQTQSNSHFQSQQKGQQWTQGRPQLHLQLMERARGLVAGIISAAGEETQNALEQIHRKNNVIFPKEFKQNQQEVDRNSDDALMESVRCFVADVMSTAIETHVRGHRKLSDNKLVLMFEDEENQPISDPHSDEQLREKVWRFVSDIITAAVETYDSRQQNQFNNNLAIPSKVQENQRILPIQDNQQIVDPYSDEHLIERVRGFVSNIMDAAQVETHDSERQLHKDNTMILPLKEEAAILADGGVRGKRGPQNLASPASNHAERLFRGGPWYVQMGRVFSAFVSRICPCRCPTKP
ncbi:uncharacterized protein LOC135225799 isoform X1 [Macrobrachium nipponense]|uniref:uncharacterized protein LOC135225799 isoform X1 n=1 Tax=Macrobrachium nipponense TaxID=159736 RepID=UPI0030C7DEE7